MTHESKLAALALELCGDERLAREYLAWLLLRAMRMQSSGYVYRGRPSTRPPKVQPKPLDGSKDFT